MKISNEIEKKTDNDLFDLKAEDFQELKKFYHQDNKNFVHFLNKNLLKIKNKEDIEKFSYIFDNLKNEIVDVSPFLSANINRIFGIMIKNNFYKQIAEYSFLLGNCANIKTLELLNEFIKSKNINKYLSTVEIYKIKKLVFDLSNKYKRNDIVYKIDLELEKEDIKWLDNIE